MNSAVLDTRSPFRVRRDVSLAHPLPAPSETQGFPAGLVVFRQLVRDLLQAPRRQRAVVLAKVVSHIRASREPLHCVNHLLFECAEKGGTDGLDIAIDVLAQVSALALVAANRFLKADFSRWKLLTAPRHSVNDDIWYALLRGICRSELPWASKLLAVVQMIQKQTPASVKEAAVQALGDLAVRNPEQKAVSCAILRLIETQEGASSVKATAGEVLRDLED